MQHLLVVTDFSGQTFGSVFKDKIFKWKGQAVRELFESLTLE
jgi:hypothetical protein